MRSSLFGVITLTILFACTPDGGGEEGSTSTGPGASETDAGETAATSGGEVPTSGADEEGETQETTDAGTTGGSDDVCAAFCANIVACDVPMDGDCVAGCELGRATYASISAACGLVSDAYYACGAGAMCDELGPGGKCSMVLDEGYALDVCTSDVCEAYADNLIMCGFADAGNKLGIAYECSLGLAGALEYGEACLAAEEVLYTCSSKVACDQIQSGEACQAEEDAADEACGL